jgi:thiol-disulfide isomerase/thioredoxin
VLHSPRGQPRAAPSPRLPAPRASARRAGTGRARARLSSTRRAAGAAMLMTAVSLAVAGCEGGAIGQNTPASNGQSFVSGSPGTTTFGAGKGPAVPQVAGAALGGGKLSLAQFHGRVLVVNFWGSWCTPCRAEAPTLAALAQHFRAAGVQFLGVDIRDSPASAEAFRRNFHISYPSLNDPADEIALAFRNTVPPAGIPTTLVISRNGRVTARIVGAITYDGLRSLISQAMVQRA